MRVPVKLSEAFKSEFEPVIAQFLLSVNMIPDVESIRNRRFLTRSVAPHVKTLSQLFNRITEEETKKGAKKAVTNQIAAIDEESYYKEGGNPQNRRLAYFLSFMPPNLFRVASVWSELYRLGFKWPFPADSDFKGIEFGAGTASGACGILAGEKFAPIGLPERGNFALIEQSRAALQLGTQWLEHYGRELFPERTYDVRPFHRRVELGTDWLPRAAPKFNLFVMSYFLNECDLGSDVLARQFVRAVDAHLEENGIVIIVEPALKLQSRRLLNFRRAVLEQPEVISGKIPIKVLLPCLGHQACGALAAEGDWCHEEVSWWRPEYLRTLDSLVHLDRKTLPFSYLVLTKSQKPIEEILPALGGPVEKRFRLVSPSHELGPTREFFICGVDGKRRARYRVPGGNSNPNRGDIFLDVEHHGDRALTQISKGKMVTHEGDDEEEEK